MSDKDPPKSVSGQAYPAVSGQPVPIVLSRRTLISLSIPTVITVIGALSVGIYFYQDTQIHKKDVVIHFEKKEKPTFQTKADAKEDHKEIVKVISREQKVVQRELAVEQAEQIKRLGEDLTRRQERNLRTLIREGRQTRSAIRDIGGP
jgi:phosphoglycerate-specific signal transduction histidine kinase